MENHIYHLPPSLLPSPTARHNFALRLANLHLAFHLIRRFNFNTPESNSLIAPWDCFLCPFPAFSHPIDLDNWPMKGINNLVVIMETLRNICGRPIFATEPGFEEPWALWYLAAAMAQTWTRDPLGLVSGVPEDMSCEELRQKTEEVYEVVRKVSVKVWVFNYIYHSNMVEQRWYDMQTARMKECYDGGDQDGAGHEEPGENGEGDGSTADVQEDVEDGKKRRQKRRRSI